MSDTVFHPGRGHSDTVHFADNDMLDQAGMDEVSRVTWVGVAVNIFLAIAKGTAGFAAGATALIADAAHTVSDLVSDAVVLIGVKFWCAPADAEHPHGHRKIETMITLGIGIALAVVGLGMGYRAVINLGSTITGVAEREHVDFNLATVLAFCAAIVSLIAKELLYRWTAAKGVELQSSAVVANAWHHRSDAFSSIPPALSIGGGAVGAWLGYDLWFLDPIGTLIVCVMLLQAAWEVCRPTMGTLVDASADRTLCSAIRKTILSTPGVLDTHKIRTRCIGPNAVAVDLHILVPGKLTATEGHDIATLVKKRVLALKIEDRHHPVDVMVHVEPGDTLEQVLRRGQESDTMADWKAKK